MRSRHGLLASFSLVALAASAGAQAQQSLPLSSPPQSMSPSAGPVKVVQAQMALQDNAVAAPHLYGARSEWGSRRRGVDFYDDSYAHEGERAQLYARWRALGAKGSRLTGPLRQQFTVL